MTSANTIGANTRPTTYTKEIGAEIFSRLMQRETLIDGKSLHRICADPDMPAIETAVRWLAEEKDFYAWYARAHDYLLREFEDELLDIVDDSAGDWAGKVDRRGNVVAVLNRRHLAMCLLRLEVRCWIADQRWPHNPVKFGKRTRKPRKERSQ